MCLIRWQGYDNASIEVEGEEELDIVEEFYSEEANVTTQSQTEQQSESFSHVQDIQQSLRQSVQALN